jgi:hypothetical protein
MKYKIESIAFNVSGEQIENQTLSIDADTKKVKFSSYFERHDETSQFESIDEAFHALLEFLNVPNKYFYEELTGCIFSLYGMNEIYKTGYTIKGVK